MSEIAILSALTFLVAFIYSSVGHGGASGYLAVLSFFAVPHVQMSTSALGLNLLVSGLSFRAYCKAHHFSWKLTYPFILTSIPAAFAGGLIKISASLYALLLAGVLLFAALRLLVDRDDKTSGIAGGPPLWVSLVTGGLIGLLSGMVGFGGGIFLSPILLLFQWADPKKTAATSAFFILVNSVSGLLGRFMRGGLQFTPHLSFLVLAAFLGGISGSQLGACHFSTPWLRRILALVLFLAAFKLLRFH